MFRQEMKEFCLIVVCLVCDSACCRVVRSDSVVFVTALMVNDV
jgi:hypothetical protein